MKGRILSPREAFEIYSTQGAIWNVYTGKVKYPELVMSLPEFIASDWYEYVEPPKPKNLLERFAELHDIDMTYDSGHIYADHNRIVTTSEVINWLDKQPESRLIIKKDGRDGN